jgi:hypothetical protein
MITQKYTKSDKTYKCESCDYICCSSRDFDKHKLTRKHEISMEPLQNDYIKIHKCECGKIYKHRQGLYAHKKLCTDKIKQPNIQTQVSTLDLTNLVVELMKSNNELQKQNSEFQKQSQDFQKQLLEICKNGTHITNSNNKAFNINLFLNEKCKDAINFSDFLNSIEVSHEDLENNAQLGFVSGISKILLDQLKQMNETERPIHCTDAKRETMYVKDDNKWEKDEINAKLSSAIREVSRKSLIALMGWKSTNDDYKDMDSEFSNKCITMQLQSVAGYNRDTYYPKIFKTVAKEMVIEKDK